MQENNSQVVIYQTESGETKLDVTFNDETVWLTQMQLCLLFNKSKATISEHIFEEGEISHQIAMEKSSAEFEKYKDVRKQVEKENSIKELEGHLRELTNKIETNIK